MDFLSKVNNLLNKPFPEEESSLGQTRNLGLLSLFIFLFLFIFQPFGISTYDSNKFWLCLGFGLTTFIAMLVYTFLLKLIVRIKGAQGNWTFGKWILNNIVIMLFISVANFLFSRLWIIGFIDWSLFPHMMYGTLMIGIIPLVILGAVSLNWQEKKYQKISKAINLDKSESQLNPKSSKQIFEIAAEHIRFVEALQNYVKIGYVNQDGSFKTKTERSTLKNILEESIDTNIIKCHRSYLVNRDAIISTEGNAQGLILSLKDCEQAIPVSRSYVAEFRR